MMATETVGIVILHLLSEGRINLIGELMVGICVQIYRPSS